MRKRHIFCLWLACLICHTYSVSPASDQTNLPDLAQIKTAAEKGDADAQDKLAENYWWSFDFPRAVEWYRKSAEQGNAHAQLRLGELLVNGKPKMGQSETAVPKAPEEAVKWNAASANQGFVEAQTLMGKCYENGWVVKQEFVEAYKWYRLAYQKHKLSGEIDRVILKLSQAQIQEGEKRAREFVAHKMMKGELPPPMPLAQAIVLNGISGTPEHRLAILNHHTFEKGEEGTVTMGMKSVAVRVLEIKEKSVVIQIEGVQKPEEIRLK